MAQPTRKITTRGGIGRRGAGGANLSSLPHNQTGFIKVYVNTICLSLGFFVYYVNFRWYSHGLGFSSPTDATTSAIQLITEQTSKQLQSSPSHSSFSSSSSPQLLAEGKAPDVAPFRDSEERAQDVRCLHQGVSHLHFHHMRKAGGSSLRTLLVNMAKIQAIPHVLHISQSEGLTFNVTCFTEGPRVFLTSIRDPISRIISSYKYEGHAERLDDRMFPGYDTPEELINQLEAGKELKFREWVDRVLQRYANDPADFKADHVWVDVDNYYIKTLTNRHRDVSKPIDANDLQLAKRILASFDLVVITEWMNQADQTEYMNRMLGTTIKMNFPHRQIASTWKHQGLIDDDTLKYLKQLNKYDIELYEYAKELTKSRIEAFIGSLGEEGKEVGSFEERRLLLEVAEAGKACVVPKIHAPEYTFEGHKYIITRGIHPDPVCMYPRDIYFDYPQPSKYDRHIKEVHRKQKAAAANAEQNGEGEREAAVRKLQEMHS